MSACRAYVCRTTPNADNDDNDDENNNDNDDDDDDDRQTDEWMSG